MFRVKDYTVMRLACNTVDLASSLRSCIPPFVAGVLSDDISLQIEATTNFRKILAADQSPPIEEVIQCGVVPRFVEFLTRDDFPQLQFEAAWALTNSASGTSDHTSVVIAHRAVPLLVNLMSSPCENVREQVVWALGNIAGDSTTCRDFVLSHGALPTLLRFVNEHAKLSMLRIAAWTLSTFCRGKPHPPFEQMKLALPALVDHGCIPTLCNLLICPDPLVNKICLEGLEHILKVGEAEKSSGGGHETNIYVSVIEQAGGMEKIENLQFHENIDIYQKAIKILETYWLNEDEKEYL